MKHTGSNLDCIYGETGSTKTCRIGDAAEFFFKKTGLPARLVSSDPGGWEPIQSLIDEGIIDAFKLTIERGDQLIETMDKLSRGWWLADSKDPLSKMTPPDLSKVSLLAWDGFTSTCNLLMQFHEQAVKYHEQNGGSISATTVRVPEMPRDSFIKSGDYVRRFTGRSDYGGVQERIGEFCRNLGMLPIRTLGTALETQGKDEKKLPVYGPDFIGQALTGVCGPWFGNLIHLDFVPMEEEIKNPARPNEKLKVLKPKPFMFLRGHIDPADPYKLVYPAKVRAPRNLWERVPDLMEPRLDRLYEMLDKLAAEEVKTLRTHHQQQEVAAAVVTQ